MGRRGVFGASSGLTSRLSASNHAEDENHKRDDQESVDETAADVEGEETQGPSHNQYDQNQLEHFCCLLLNPETLLPAPCVLRTPLRRRNEPLYRRLRRNQCLGTSRV